MSTLRPTEAHEQALVASGDGSFKPVNGLALIDTGAAATCVDESLARRVGLAVVDAGPISSATHEHHVVPIFACRLEISGLGTINCPRAMGVTIENQGLVAVIGRDVLKSTVLIYNGSEGTYSLCV